MERSSRSNLLGLFQMIIRWRKATENSCNWNDLHLSVVRNYFSKFSSTSDLGEASIFTNIVASFTRELRHLFTVPSFEKLYDGHTDVKRHQLLKVFVSFLLQLLHLRRDLSFCSNCASFDCLDKELRFLLTVLSDTSLMLLCDARQEFHKLLAGIEAIANEAGALVHSLFFESAELDEGLAAFFDNVQVMAAGISELLNFLPCMGRWVPGTCVADSLHMVDSLVYDLKEGSMKPEDNGIADHIEKLHQGLTSLQSCFKDIRALRPSEIEEFRDPLMRIGDMAHEAEYLIISFLGGDAPLWYIAKRLTDVNNRIQQMGTELHEITMIWRLRTVQCLSKQPVIQPEESSIEVNDVVVGCEEKTRYLLDHLLGRSEGRQVISIVGTAGLGKTTLAKKLYNYPSVQCWFDRLSWCVVSQTFHKKKVLIKLLTDIATELDDKLVLQLEEESLVEHIYKTLKSRRYLIVLDDVWDPDVWYDLQTCFPDDRNGSRILFTSRIRDVAPPDTTIYAMPCLLKDQCWALLRKKVLGSKACPPQLRAAGKKIAANCFGVPLAVIAIAGILSSTDLEEQAWERVGGNVASCIFDGGSNSVMRVLELSYKHLPEHLKACFLYFGAFREDEEISVREVTRLWVAEGFVHKVGDKGVEDIAEEYLIELVDKSLVMVAKRRSDGGVKSCTLHDLWRDLCFRRSTEDNLLKSVKSNDNLISERGYRLKALQHSSTSYYCQHVRSFHGRGLISTFYVRDMRSLRVLSFYYCYRPIYFMGVQYLVNLRYLVITYLPPSIGRLTNLEYLRVETEEEVHLPPAVMKMLKLRCIHVNTEAIYDKHCSSSERNNIESLSRVRISRFEHQEMLKSSPHLSRLKCWYDAYQHFDLRFLAHLDSLTARFWPNMKEFEFPYNIRKLSLHGSKFSSEKMSIVGKLKQLEVLKLRSWAMVGQAWETRDGEFQQLRFLKLDRIGISEWKVESTEHFPKLQKLVLSYCPNLEEIPTEIGEIGPLVMIEVRGQCLDSLVESARIIHQEQLDIGNDDLSLVISTY
ncbi:putative late blight resistance protein homolog R1A-3 [Salvia hispanica]|uniref:putative late blight resistance protein homolog R1A-3 n=1 Tax=Salvia hispanica TaxID=49212 RepID=UPI00200949E4|nr:putative late blight resistance protein homolog R1A-3 [Salvia hispanica]